MGDQPAEDGAERRPDHERHGPRADGAALAAPAARSAPAEATGTVRFLDGQTEIAPIGNEQRRKLDSGPLSRIETVDDHLLAFLWQALWVALILHMAAGLFRRSVLKSGPAFRWPWQRRVAP